MAASRLVSDGVADLHKLCAGRPAHRSATPSRTILRAPLATIVVAYAPTYGEVRGILRKNPGVTVAPLHIVDPMSDYRRYFVPGGTYFFTVVARHRAEIFATTPVRRLLGNVLRECRRRMPFETLAIVLLPDHLHTLWTLPSGDSRYSERWRWIKREFTRGWLDTKKHSPTDTRLLATRSHQPPWQRRFWEHVIRDESDLEAHFDYIHYNPMKHGHVESPPQLALVEFSSLGQARTLSDRLGAGVIQRKLPGGAGE